MFTGACKKYWEMDWQLVVSYFTVKSTDIFCSVTLKICVRVFLGSIQARNLKVSIHMDNELVYKVAVFHLHTCLGRGNILRVITCLRKSEATIKRISGYDVIEKLTEHGIHCLACSYTNDVIALSP